VELSAERRNGIFLPRGLAHGFLTLVDGCELEYLISTPYDARAAAGVRWDDPAVGIQWPFTPEVLSERDAGFPDLDRRRVAADGPAGLA
jgi:dTDP-4-dehydrorhamnose 3,5-epimerase